MRSRTIIRITFSAALLCLISSWAAAQSLIQLKSVAEVDVVTVDPTGKKQVRRVPAANVVSGQEVIFTTYFENVSSKLAENAVIINPIPENMVYKENSVMGAGTRIAFSIDGGNTYDSPSRLFVIDAAGRKFPMQPRDYTHIRWTFEAPVPPGARGRVSYRAFLK